MPRFRLRRHLVPIVAVAALCLPAGAWLISGRIDDNCQRVHVLYLALDGILVDNDARIDRAVRTGVISSRTGADSHEFNARARARLKEADCG
jgi:hypothetical protein